MSLLEDIFLGDEANEAQELERIIDGDEYEERRRSRSRSLDSNENSEREDEAEEDKRRVDPSTQKAKRVVKNPRQVLNPARLTGPRGISIIPDHFKDFKFKGKGHEKEDLDLVLKKLEHWAYRLYPKFQFEDCLKKIETLGKKQAVSVHLRKIRSDQLTTDEAIVQKDSSDDEETQPVQEEDEFDKLLQQQIELARSTPAPNSMKKGFMTPGNQAFAPPKATSSPSINEEQRERMLRNRKLAEERRLARMNQTNDNSFENNTKSNEVKSADNSENEIDLTAEQTKIRTKNNKVKSVDNNENQIDLTAELTRNGTKSDGVESVDHSKDEIDLTAEPSRIGNVRGEIDLTENDDIKTRKQNKSNVIESSDEESEVIAINQSINVDVHVKNNTEENGRETEIIEGNEKVENSNTDEIISNMEVEMD